MALNAMGLGFIITAKDMASKVFQKVGKAMGGLKGKSKASGQSIDEVSGALDSMGKKMMLAGAAGLAGLGLVVKASNEFATQIAVLQGVTGTAGTVIGDRLKEAALKASLVSEFDPSQAAGGLIALSQAGLNAEEAMTALSSALDMATASAGLLTPQETAGLVAQGMKGFGLEANKSRSIVDKLTKAANSFNLSMKQLPLGLGASIQGAQTLGQSLDETLIAFGLVKNVLPRTATAGTAVSVAMRSMADPKIQKELKKQLGVQVVQNGKFKDFLDIINEMQPALNKMTQAEQKSTLQKMFGAQAATGLNIIMEQLTKGVRTSSGQLLKGADAIAYFRKKIGGADGAVKTMVDARLKTLPGQLGLLGGAVKGLGVKIGDDLAKLLKPAVQLIAAGISKMVEIWGKLPAPVRQALIGLVAFASVVLIGVGAIIAITGAVVALVAAKAVLITAFKIAGGVVAGFLVLMAPVVLLAAGLYLAYKNNIGGLADFLKSAFDKVRVAFEALSQIIQTGGLSGKVRDEFFKSSEGVQGFVTRVAGMYFRVQHFLKSLGEGFKSGLEAAEPGIEALKAALSGLAEAFGLSSRDSASAKASWEAVGEVGGRIGKIIAKGFQHLLTIGTPIINFITGIVEGFGSAQGPISAFDAAIEAIVSTVEIVAEAFTGVSTNAAQGTSAAQRFGQVIGFIARVVANTVSTLVLGFSMIAPIVGGAFGAAIAIFRSLFGVISGVVRFIGAVFTGDWTAAWNAAKSVVFSVVEGIVSAVSAMVEGIAAAIDAVGKAAGKDLGAKKLVAGAKADILKDLKGAMKLETAAPKLPPPTKAPVLPDAVAQAPAPTQPSGTPAVAGAQNTASMTQTLQAMQQNQKQPQVNANIELRSTLELDANPIAEKVVEINKQLDAREGAS